MKLSGMILVCALIFSTYTNASEAIGYYSSGKLKDGDSIIERGTPVHKLFMQRGRFFGTQIMQDTISDAADFVRQTYPDAEQLQIGDIAQKGGGVLKEHGSHQNGLDADIVYLTKNKKLQSQNAAFWEEEFVKNGVVSENLDLERSLNLFRYLVTTHPVERIFVDVAIKKAFCTYAKKNNLLTDKDYVEALRRLRVEDLHTNHFHMRLTCPKTDMSCKSQAAVPAGSGC
ncbi:MAG: penicillin-insensitive murein endopeptidase [Rhizobacter sp.]|nr:penicillin-insensitive murein endopeptidase [Bacteriovorax sp.]